MRKRYLALTLPTLFFVVPSLLSVVTALQGSPWLSFVTAIVAVWAFVDVLQEIKNLGVGQVPAEAEELSARLRHGIIYEVMGSIRDFADYIVLVKNIRTLEVYAIRVKSEPPKVFTLVAGKAVTVTR